MQSVLPNLFSMPARLAPSLAPLARAFGTRETYTAMLNTLWLGRDRGHAQRTRGADRPSAELYARPASAFIAGFLGAANFVPGEVQIEADGRTALRCGDLCLHGVTHAPLNGRGLALLRPEDGTLHVQPPATADGNLLVDDVVHSEFRGGHWRHVVAVAHDLNLRVLTPVQAPATRVWLQFRLERCLLLPDTP